jgi:hypothetical protein
VLGPRPAIPPGPESADLPGSAPPTLYLGVSVAIFNLFMVSSNEEPDGSRGGCSSAIVASPQTGDCRRPPFLLRGRCGAGWTLERFSPAQQDRRGPHAARLEPQPPPA